jgi:3-hydroxyisobutyrate dehydrogenase-like beta-hydroxyacid dehydrogenase
VTDVGFVGLGNMGAAMVRRLLEQGHRVTVWNRSTEAVDELCAFGAARTGSVADVFAAGPVFSMLADDAAVDSVFDDAALAAAGAGAVHVNMATISVVAAKRQAERHRAAGVGYVASPVLGRPDVAAAGKLNLLVAGDEAIVNALGPVLDDLGVRIWRLGEVPARANLTKIAMNYLIIHALVAMSEGITLAERHGLEGKNLVELFSHTLLPGPVYTGYGSVIAEKKYLPAGFATVLGAKDLGLARDAAAAVDLDLPTMSAVSGVFMAAIDGGYGEHDWAAIAETVRNRYASQPHGDKGDKPHGPRNSVRSR